MYLYVCMYYQALAIPSNHTLNQAGKWPRRDNFKTDTLIAFQIDLPGVKWAEERRGVVKCVKIIIHHHLPLLVLNFAGT